MKPLSFAERASSAVFTHPTLNGVGVAAITEDVYGRKAFIHLGTFADPEVAQRHREAVVDAVIATRRRQEAA